MSLREIVNPGVVESAGELNRQFDSATPFRHLVLDDFFDESFCQRLADQFPPFDERRAMNENGEVGAKCVHERLDALADSYMRTDRLIQSPEFLGWLSKVSGIDELLYDPDYVGGGTHENRHGQELDPHVDFNRHPRFGWHRRLNLIVYLNREWRDEWDGAIEFHTDPRLPREQNHVTRVEPLFNRAVLFETTDWSWHGFSQILLPDADDDQRSRKSTALYFYSRQRPEAERGRPHSTIYVERPLPEHIQPGVTLSESDHREIVRLLARRDQHLQRLYDNIAELGQRIEDVQQRMSIRGRLWRLADRMGVGGVLRRIRQRFKRFQPIDFY